MTAAPCARCATPWPIDLVSRAGHCQICALIVRTIHLEQYLTGQRMRWRVNARRQYKRKRQGALCT